MKNIAKQFATPFKLIIPLLAVLGLVLAGTVRAPSAEELLAPGTVDFQGCFPSQAVMIYGNFTGATLYVDSRVKDSTTPIFCTTEKPMSKADVVKLLEQALLEQAAVVITKLDSNRVSVTFNDALPTKSVRKGKGI